VTQTPHSSAGWFFHLGGLIGPKAPQIINKTQHHPLQIFHIFFQAFLTNLLDQGVSVDVLSILGSDDDLTCISRF